MSNSDKQHDIERSIIGYTSPYRFRKDKNVKKAYPTNPSFKDANNLNFEEPLKLSELLKKSTKGKDLVGREVSKIRSKLRRKM